MRVAIELSERSYLPEAYAYAAYLKAKGWEVFLGPRGQFIEPCDVTIVFMGWLPFWRRGEVRSKLIAEYHSASTGSFPRIKNVVKSITEAKPDGRIFLDESVGRAFPFIWKAPNIFREMGVDKEFFDRPVVSPEFDLVYAGSIRGRSGIVECIERLSISGLTMLVVGEVDDGERARLEGMNGISLAGKLSRAEIPGALRRARAGLNYMPNTYPLNSQPSTKVLEYCAVGIGVVSSRYGWAVEFAKDRGLQMLWLDGLHGRAEFDSFDFCPVDVSDLEWSAVLDRSGLDPFLKRVVGE